eukprot:465650_1
MHASNLFYLQLAQAAYVCIAQETNIDNYYSVSARIIMLSICIVITFILCCYMMPMIFRLLLKRETDIILSKRSHILLFTYIVWTIIILTTNGLYKFIAKPTMSHCKWVDVFEWILMAISRIIIIQFYISRIQDISPTTNRNERILINTFKIISILLSIPLTVFTLTNMRHYPKYGVVAGEKVTFCWDDFKTVYITLYWVYDGALCLIFVFWFLCKVYLLYKTNQPKHMQDSDRTNTRSQKIEDNDEKQDLCTYNNAYDSTLHTESESSTDEITTNIECVDVTSTVRQFSHLPSGQQLEDREIIINDQTKCNINACKSIIITAIFAFVSIISSWILLYHINSDNDYYDKVAVHIRPFAVLDCTINSVCVFFMVYGCCCCNK